MHTGVWKHKKKNVQQKILNYQLVRYKRLSQFLNTWTNEVNYSNDVDRHYLYNYWEPKHEEDKHDSTDTQRATYLTYF